MSEIQNYSPQPLPREEKELPRFFYDELKRISVLLELLASGQIDASNAAPDRPREGMIRLADGTNWNPGHGAGLYVYFNSIWYPVATRLLYGSMYSYNTSATLTLSVADTDKTLVGLTGGPEYGITFQNNSQLLVSVSAIYSVKWSISFSGAVANDDFEAGVVVGSTLKTNTVGHRKIGAANDIGNMGCVGYITASAGQTIALVMRNKAATNNALVNHSSLILEYVDKT